MNSTVLSAAALVLAVGIAGVVPIWLEHKADATRTVPTEANEITIAMPTGFACDKVGPATFHCLKPKPATPLCVPTCAGADLTGNGKTVVIRESHADTCTSPDGSTSVTGCPPDWSQNLLNLDSCKVNKFKGCKP